MGKRVHSYEKKVHKVTVRLDGFEYKTLLRYCRKANCNMSDALRTGIEWLKFKMDQKL